MSLLDAPHETLRPRYVDAVKKIIKSEPTSASQFKSEPLKDYFNKIRIDECFLTIREALNIDLTDFLILDMIYRWKNAGDIAVNINGQSNSGKSNMLLDFAVKWSKVTGKPFRLSNVVYNSAEFNLLLKGFRVVDEAKDFRLEKFPLDAGISLSLDEAADIMIAGHLSLSIVLQTTDIENRMRALQIGRFCAGVREILHGAHYNIEAIERDSVNKCVYGIVQMHEKVDPASELIYLGFVRVPYVDAELFKRYNSPKCSSIIEYGRGSQIQKISRLIEFFGNILKKDREFQKLPISPSIERINYIQRDPKDEGFTIFSTGEYFENLEKMSRDAALHQKLAPNCRCSAKYHPREKNKV